MTPAPEMQLFPSSGACPTLGSQLGRSWWAANPCTMRPQGLGPVGRKHPCASSQHGGVGGE